MMRNRTKNICTGSKRGNSMLPALLVCVFLFCGCGHSDKAVSFTAYERNTAEENTIEENTIEENAMTDMGSAPDTMNRENILVYVCGAVKNPGVVELSEGSRAEAALEAAGGFAENAEKDYVNLAAIVEDGQKLYFPTVEEADALTLESSERKLVNINTAGVEQFCTLPGIGTSRALDIIAYREENGGFQSKEDIMKISGIKQNMYEKLCELITIK